MFVVHWKQGLLRLLLALIFSGPALAAGVVRPAAAAQPITLAYWDFEGETRLPAIDITGAAGATYGKGLGNETFPAGYNGSVDAWSFNNWSGNLMRDNDYVEFAIDLSEHAHIILAFAERRSASGIHGFVVDYSIDGQRFTPIPGTETVVPDDTAWRTHTFDLGWDTPVDQAIRGQSTVYFRVYGYGAEAANGTWRFDDVTISAGATPTAVTLRAAHATGMSPQAVYPLVILVGFLSLLLCPRRLRQE